MFMSGTTVAASLQINYLEVH